MMNVSLLALEKLKQNLIDNCFNAEVGYRVIAIKGNDKDVIVNLKIDMMREGDRVVVANQLKLFIGPDSAGYFTSDCELDYIYGPQSGFVLKPLIAG